MSRKKVLVLGGNFGGLTAALAVNPGDIVVGASQGAGCFGAAYGAAIDRLRDLLTSLDQAGARQPDPGWDPPHAYIPTGPVEAAPYEAYCPPEVRREAFTAVLDGVEMGAYDLRIRPGPVRNADRTRL